MHPDMLRDYELGGHTSPPTDAIPVVSPLQRTTEQRIDDSKSVAGEVQHQVNGRVYTVFLLLNSMIGSGVFNIPHVFSKTGLVSAYFLLTMAAALVYLGLVLLVQVFVEGGSDCPEDYSELSGRVLSPSYGPIITDLSIAIVGFGALLSYVSGITNMSTLLITSWTGSENLSTSYLATGLIMLFLVFPLSLQRSYGHFTGISVVSMTSVGLVLCLVVIGGPLYQAKYGTLASSSTSALLLGTGGGSAPVSQLGSIIFTFSCASATFHTFKYMRVRTLAEWRVVARTTVFCGWCLCVAMGTAGFLVFGQSTEGIILANFQMGHVGDFFQLLFILHLILYIPLDFLVARHSLLRLCGVSSGALVDNKAHAALSFLLLALATLTILFLDASNVRAGQSFSIILNFTGGLGGSIISFVLPAWLFLSQLRASGPDRFTLANVLPSAKLLLSGLLFAIYVPVSTVISAVQGSS